MDLHEVEGDGGVGEADPQDRFVAGGPAAQIAQPHLAAGDGNFLLQSLERQITVGDGHGITGRREAATASQTLGVGGAEREAEKKEGEGEGGENGLQKGAGGGGGNEGGRQEPEAWCPGRTLKWHIPASLSLWLFILSTGMTMFNSLH